MLWLGENLERGIQGAPEKHVNDSLNATVIGIDVDGGKVLCPPGKKLALTMSAATYMFDPCGNRCVEDIHDEHIDNGSGSLLMSALEVAAILGTFTHFVMLHRSTLSAYHSIYDFTRPNTANRDLGNLRKLYRKYWEYEGEEERLKPF